MEAGALLVDLDTAIVAAEVVTVAAARTTMGGEDITPAQEADTDRIAVPSLQDDATTLGPELVHLPWSLLSKEGVGVLVLVPGLDHLVTITGVALTRALDRPRWWLRLYLCKIPFRLP